jgi:5,10-methenyltetrahydrofolate synthetase
MTDHHPQTAANSLAARAEVRAALRRDKIAARLALSPETRRQASGHILDHLARLLLPRPAGVIGYCWPIRAEVDCRPLVESLLGRGWRAAMPTVVVPAAPMEFRVWWPDAPMTADPFGIPVPATAVDGVPDVLLLPLVAFDAAGYRLGYGGGYFDRTLAGCRPRPLTVGVGFECCAVESIRPEPHDVPLDAIVTETGVRHFNPP